ncbi:hypothetical protein K523DRAFT_140454 [Schizophyllum commune Tattone D]|nr:hypothetical protein K523DRAFT_140454 [Schizophyllum commune Tattone D]
MSSPNNTSCIAQSNASAINGTANPAANANAVARGPAFGAAAGSDRPLDTSEAIDTNKPKQPFQDAFLEALKTAVGGANRFVYKDHSANHPEVRLLCSVVENLPGQFGAGVDEVPEAMDDISKHIVQSLRDGAFSIQEIFPLQPGEVEPQPKKDERKFPLWPAMVHKSFNIQDVSQRYVPVSAMPNVDPALPYAFHIDRNGVEMPIDFPFELSFEPNSKKHDSTCVVFDAEEVFVPAAAAAASPEVMMEEVVATRGADDADDAAPRRDTRLATGGKGKGTSGKGKGTAGKDNGSGGKGKGKARAEPQPASDSELSDLTESETDELSSLSELTESEDEEPAPKPAGRHAKKPAAKPTKAAPKATKATAPKTTKAAAPKTTKAGASKETKASAPRATRAAAPRLVKAAPKKAAEPAPKGKQTKGKEPAAAPRATRGATTSRLTQPTAASKARATAAATKAAGASKAKATAATKATKAAAASKPAAAPRAPSRAASGKRKRDDDDEDAAPAAQRRNAAAARVSPPAAPAVRAQAGHNLRRTKAVSYKV